MALKSNKFWLDYKTVVVSGASSGIGKGLVKRLIKDHGCNVIGIARNEKKILELKEELGNYAYKFSYRLFDVSAKENWESFAEYLTENNITPSVIINCAGILPKFDKFEHYSLDYIERAMNINFYSCVYSMHYMLPIILKAEDPALINVASSAALATLSGTSVYSASKAALKSLTESAREELSGRCYVGLVCPGFTKTNIFSNQETDTSKENDWSQKALNAVSTDCDVMVDDIVKGMLKKRKTNMVFGFDAHMMNIGARTVGRGVSFMAGKVMKATKMSLFEDVFKDEK